jgi:hypothetical protein
MTVVYNKNDAVQIQIDDNPKLDSNLVFLRRLLKCSLLIFRGDDKDATISKWKLIPVTILVLTSKLNKVIKLGKDSS